MRRWKLIIGITLIFMVGALAGALGTGLYFRQKMEQLEKFRRGGSKKIDLLVKQFTRDLDLTKEQQAEVRKIIEKSESEIEDIRQKYLPKIKSIIDQSFAQMRAKLTPEQQKKLDMLHERLERSKPPNPP